jgi:hypothetical protein
MARLDTPLAPDGALPLLAGPLPGRLLRCLPTMRAGAEHPPSPPLGAGARMGDATTTGLTWALVSGWSMQACRGRAADLADLVGYGEIAAALRDEVDRDARALEQMRALVGARLLEGIDEQTCTRAVLAERWEPMDTRVVADDEVEHVLATLFGAPRGRAVAAEVDRRIDELPGLAGLDLMIGALDRRAAADRWAAEVLDLRGDRRRRSPVPA